MMFSLRTIDVWDTLLRRKSHPDFSKLVSARALFITHGKEILGAYPDHWSIYRERCRIEGELALDPSRGDGEYEVEDVLARLLTRVLRPDSTDIPAMAARLADVELEFELRQTYPDPTIRAFSQDYPAKQTLFLSDFYMSAEHLNRLLKHHALDDLVADGISSCDVGLNKRSGNLFHHVQTRLGVAPSEHVHIGDNPHADVNMPSRLGIKAVHFQPEEEHQKRMARADFLNDRKTLFRHLDEEIRTRTHEELGRLQGKASSAFLLGLRAAPLLVGFMSHIAEHALFDRIKRLFFFTREGEFFIQVWRRLFPENQLAGQVLPSAQLLEVSRIATFCASLREVSTKELMRLWNLYSTQSIYALLKTLGLPPDGFAEVCQAHGLSLKEDVVYPWQDVRVRNLFQDPAFRGSIKEKINQDRENLVAYLHEHGWGADIARLGIVDIGWRGTIQDNLALLSPHTQVHGYYLGLQRYLNEQPANVDKSAFGPDANMANDYVELLDAVSIIEMLCNSLHGSVTAYERDSNGLMRAVRLVDEEENKVHREFVGHFQRGVLAACEVWADYVDSHVITSAELRGPGCVIWRELVKNAHCDLAQTYASLSHNEVFGVGGFVDKSVVPSPTQLIQGLFSARIRRDVILYVRQTQWIAGITARDDLGPIHKLMLVGVLYLAKIYKRIHYRLK